MATARQNIQVGAEQKILVLVKKKMNETSFVREVCSGFIFFKWLQRDYFILFFIACVPSAFLPQSKGMIVRLIGL